jgi:hypothetical protein
MEQRKETMYVPKDSFERIIVAAVQTGKLKNYFTDNLHSWNHNLLKRFLCAIISLPPAKQLLARRQLRSRFLNALTNTREYELYSKLFLDGKKADYSHPELEAVLSTSL